MRILQLSDTHLDRLDEPNAYGVNSRASLRQMLEDCRHVRGIDLVLVSGDVADDGSREAYADALAMVGGFARERGVPAVFTTGNHDERRAFTEVLGSGHLDPTGADGATTVLASEGGERAAVSVIDGYRVVSLDSLVPGKGYGLISRVQLDWLRGVLAEPAEHGTVIAFHHPPFALDVEVQEALRLQNPDELVEAIRGTDVRLVLCGHFHQAIMGRLAGLPVWVTPGVVTRIDLTGAPGTERAVRGASASVVDLGGPHSPLVHVLHARDPQVGETAYALDADQLATVIARLGP
jgi:Icc protein